MAYLTKDDLQTHLYAETIMEIVRDYSTTYANLAAFPATGITGRFYVAQDTSKTYKWQDGQYQETTPVDITAKAIAAAIGEVKSYLARYDLLKLFGDDDTLPTVVDANLKFKVADVACWHLVKLAAPNIKLELFRTLYEDAIKWFKDIQKGMATPDGWPYKVDNPDTPNVDESNADVRWNSNKKRTNHW